MEKLKSIVLIIPALFLVMACSQLEDDELLTDVDLKCKRPGPEVILVTPNGVDDTENLLAAFDKAIQSGRGSVVKLAGGEFHVGYMEVYDFYGSLVGAGKSKTIITVLPGMNLDELFAQNKLHCMVKFIGGDVQLKNFTIQTPPGLLSTGGPGYGHIYTLMNFSSFNPDYGFGDASRSINVVIDNVSFKGQWVEEGGVPGYTGYSYNCYFGVRAGFDYFPVSAVPDVPLPRERIDFKITNCDFNTFVYGIVLEGTMNSRLTVGEKYRGNVFNNIDQQVGVWESRNAFVRMEGNTFNIPEYGYGMDLDDWPYYSIFRDEPSTRPAFFDVQYNIFNMNTSEYAMLLRNYRTYTNPEEPAAIYQVKNNIFRMTAGYEWGIFSLYTKGVMIFGNKFTGYGDLGLYFANYSQKGLVLWNLFSTAQFETAVARLTPSTKDFTLIGSKDSGCVINLGTNNKIIGFTECQTGLKSGKVIEEDQADTKNELRDLKKQRQ